VSSNAAASPPHLENLLESLWTKVFELPVEENPFSGGDHCLMLSDPRNGKPVLAPFAPSSNEPPPCTVPLGTELLVTAWSSECSNVEAPPYHGDGEAGLRKCARDEDADLDVIVMFDGRPVQLKEVETGLMRALLPEGNIFSVPTGTPIESVGHGWVALLPLTRGQHTVIVHTTGTYDDGTDPPGPGPVDWTVTTRINVTR